MFFNPPPHYGRKSLILAPQEIPDISGYQWGFGCQFDQSHIWALKALNALSPKNPSKVTPEFPPQLKQKCKKSLG